MADPRFQCEGKRSPDDLEQESKHFEPSALSFGFDDIPQQPSYVNDDSANEPSFGQFDQQHDAWRALDPAEVAAAEPFGEQDVEHDNGGFGFSGVSAVSAVSASSFDMHPSKAKRSELQPPTFTSAAAMTPFHAMAPKSIELPPPSEMHGPVAAPPSEVIDPWSASAPDPPGGYLEPAFHFFCTVAPALFVSTITVILTQLHIVVQPCAELFKLNCNCYTGGSRLPFVISIFSADKRKNRYAVEFQRRSGCCLQFANIFHEVKHALQARNTPQQLFIDEPALQPARDTPPPASAVTAEQANATIISLLQMAGSDCADVKIVALDAVSEMSKDPSVQSVILKDRVATAPVIACLFSPDEVYHRPALTTFANLTDQGVKRREDFCHILLDPKVMAAVCCHVSSSSVKVVRETARVLVNFVEAMQPHTWGAFKDGELTNAASVLACSNDRETSVFAQRIWNRFEALESS